MSREKKRKTGCGGKTLVSEGVRGASGMKGSKEE